MRIKRYDSDLTDSQWKQISHYFTTGRKRCHAPPATCWMQSCTW
ncbi:hypothetical protein GGP72_002920 [Salinibacter ruber]|uniref:Uncharacterized protein n=1 Tax=Salinibacter ruber TaxID=146919 RepID=A0A9X2PY38_9BACT|nr:hypothetical protein [Salinibacter ruber]MCS3682260.1 hypothetical protein [Salinibacter ruber]MCS4044860.1 hypothetical protein [Salinibacter ruber]